MNESASRFELRPLRESDRDAFNAAVREFEADDPAWEFAFHYDPRGNFADYVQRLRRWERGEGLPAGFVPNSYLVAVVDGAVVGRLSLRHELCDAIAEVGGHVGYGVIPSQRRRGYASEMLRRVRPVAARLGLRRLLITCADSNAASICVIENAGGKFDRLAIARDGVTHRRYWLTTMPADGNSG